ncbi:hypothetical protein ABK040_008825 [Willaertia magna]
MRPQGLGRSISILNVNPDKKRLVKKKEWDSSINDLSQYKLSREEQEAKKKKLISKNVELVLKTKEKRPQSAPHNRANNSNTSVNTSPKKASPKALKQPSVMKVHVQTTKAEKNNVQSKSNSRKSLTPSEFSFYNNNSGNQFDITNEDNEYYNEQWTNNKVQDKQQVSYSQSQIDQYSLTDIDYIKKELFALKNNIARLENDKSFEIKKDNTPTSLITREKELEERNYNLQKELDESRKSYSELETQFKKYQFECEIKIDSLLKRIEELEKREEELICFKGNENIYCENENDSQENNFDYTPFLGNMINDKQISSRNTQPSTTISLDENPRLKSSIGRYASCSSSDEENRELNSDAYLNAMRLEEGSPSSDDVLSYGYKYSNSEASINVNNSDNTGNIEVHKPMIVGRDFSNTLIGTQITTKNTHTTKVPVFSTPTVNAIPISSGTKAMKFNLRPKQ